MAEALLLLVKISVGALILAIGMGATLADLIYVWRRPGLLLRSLLAMYVLVPLAAFLLVKAWPLAPGVKAALLVLAVSAGAPRCRASYSVSGATPTSSALSSPLRCLPSWSYRPGSLCLPGISASRRSCRRPTWRRCLGRRFSYRSRSACCSGRWRRR